MSLNAVVKGKEKNNRQWREVADVVSVSATGSSFNLPRRCGVGTLISVMVPLPLHLRCYDYDKEFYKAWGLVQHCAPVEGKKTFHIGVAFIGKEPPASYNDNPRQCYRIAGVGGDGMWTVTETKAPFKPRADVRFWKPVDLYLAVVDRKEGSPGGERTVAENISRSGAAVFTTLDVGIGDRVKFISEAFDFSGLAVVCNRQVGADDKTRLHLKFIENLFPVEILMRSSMMVQKI